MCKSFSRVELLGYKVCERSIYVFQRSWSSLDSCQQRIKIPIDSHPLQDFDSVRLLNFGQPSGRKVASHWCLNLSPWLLMRLSVLWCIYGRLKFTTLWATCSCLLPIFLLGCWLCIYSFNYWTLKIKRNPLYICFIGHTYCKYLFLVCGFSDHFHHGSIVKQKFLIWKRPNLYFFFFCSLYFHVLRNLCHREVLKILAYIFFKYFRVLPFTSESEDPPGFDFSVWCEAGSDYRFFVFFSI